MPLDLLLLLYHGPEGVAHTLNVATKTAQVVAFRPGVLDRGSNGRGRSKASQYPGYQCLAPCEAFFCQNCAHIQTLSFIESVL